MIRPKIASFFNASDKILRTDTRYIAKGGFWLSLGQGVAMISGFLLSLAFANLFSKESFGIYKFIISVAGILTIFSLTEVGTAITRAVARGFGGSLRYAFLLNLKWSIGILVGGLGISLYYFINENYILSVSFVFAAFLLPLSSSGGLYTAFLLGKKNFRKVTWYGVVRNVVPAATLIAALFLTKNIVLIMLVYFASSAAVSISLYVLTKRLYKTDDDSVDPELTSYSKHLSFMQIIGQGANQLDKILVFHYLGAAPLAIYAFAIAPVEQLQGGKKILSSLVFPKVSEQSFENLQRSTPRKSFLLAFYALLLAGIYIVIAPYFYKIFFPQYIDSVIYSQIYSLTLLAIFGTMFDSTLIAHNKKRELYVHRTVVTIIKIILFIVLLPPYGLMGLIISHVIIRTFSGFLGYYFVKHPFKTS